MKLTTIFPLVSLLFGLTCSAGAIPHGGPRTKNARQVATGLNAAMQQHGRFFGTFSDGKYLDDGAYVEILGGRGQFEMFTPGNSMKWDTTEASEGDFDFSEADSIVEFARENGQVVRGHTLVWHSQLPQWVSDIEDPEILTGVVDNHIETLMTHWKGQNVVHRDVVNEPFEESGEYRDSVFYNLLGKEYINGGIEWYWGSRKG